MSGPNNNRQRLIEVVAAVAVTIDSFLIEQIRAMEQAGFGVSVVCSPDRQSAHLTKQALDRHPILIPRSIRPLVLLKAVCHLYGLFRRTRPAVIHTHTPMAAFLGQVAAWLAGVPHRVTTVHGLYFVNERRPLQRFLFKWLEILACRLATKVICVSQEDTQYLAQRHGFPPEKIATFHVGVNLDVYSPQVVGPAERRGVRAELGIPDDALVFGIVARMVREKGFMELFEAFARLTQKHPNVYLLHVGPIDNSRGDAITPREAERLGCAAACRFVGMQQAVARYLSAMDVFVLPTHREGYPVSVMEAAAMGLPSIVTDVRGCRESVVAGETGLVVPARDPAALEQAMEQLLLDPQLRQTLARNALQRAREHFDRKLIVARTLELYRRELGETASLTASADPPSRNPSRADPCRG